MTWDEVKLDIRNNLLMDPLNRKWSDADIEYWMNEAQLKYVETTGVLKALMEIVPDIATEKYFYPDNFLELVYAYNYDSQPINPSTYDELLFKYGGTFQDVIGTPIAIYDDDSSEKAFKLYPTPEIGEEGAGFEYEENTPYGIIQNFDDDGVVAPVVGSPYGVIYKYYDDATGIEVYPDVFKASPGEVTSVIDLPGGPIGRIQYIRKPLEGMIEISDAEAIKYYAVSMAYTQETAWKDLKYADAMMSEFDRLIHKDEPASEVKQSNINYF